MAAQMKQERVERPFRVISKAHDASSRNSGATDAVLEKKRMLL
jgi:hypothetical protein